MSNMHSRSLRGMAGFGLVEIMVAMVIGMIAILVVMQVFLGAESRGRTAGGNADAQSVGAMAFMQLQGQIKKAGYGIDSIALFRCPLTWTLPNGAAISNPITLAPVSINPRVGSTTALLLPPGDANTDTLLVFYGTGNGQPQGNVVTNVAGQTYTVQMPASFAVGDRVVLANDTSPDTCGAGSRLIDRITGVSPLTVTVATGQTGGAMPSLFNFGRGPNGINALITASNPSNGPSVFAYAVRNGSLTVCDFTLNDCGLAASATQTTVWVPIADHVVSMRATYWRDNSAAWDGSSVTVTQTAPDLTQPNPACNWARIKAVNLVLVVRNPERDKEIVTKTTLNGVAAVDANRPIWDQEAIAPLVASTGALGPDAAADEEWKHYRYKTLQALIPLRNVAWMGQPTGCP